MRYLARCREACDDIDGAEIGIFRTQVEAERACESRDIMRAHPYRISPDLEWFVDSSNNASADGCDGALYEINGQ